MIRKLLAGWFALLLWLALWATSILIAKLVMLIWADGEFIAAIPFAIIGLAAASVAPPAAIMLYKELE